jgi:transcriptional regulator of acetoin/glycerol metabolism
MSHDWPGNIRQLFGALEYAFLRAAGERIERGDLPEEIYTSPTPAQTGGDAPSVAAEKEKIEHLLMLYPRNRRRVAHELGISRTTLWRRIQDLGIEIQSNG